jgi:hypothetical protein
MSIQDLRAGMNPSATPVIYDSSPDCSNIKQYAKTIVEFMKLIQMDNPNQFISQNDVLDPEPVSPNKSYFDEPDGGIRLFSKARPLKKEDYPFLGLLDSYPPTPTTEQAMAILTGFKEFKSAVASRKRLAAVLNKFENSLGQPYVIEDFRNFKTQIGITSSPFGEGYLTDMNTLKFQPDRIIVDPKDNRRYFKYQTFDNLMEGVRRCMQIGGYRQKRSGRKQSGSRKRSTKRRSSRAKKTRRAQ